ncbi:MAG: PepSY domain-containing protein [Pseudoxanthomonas sp.]
MKIPLRARSFLLPLALVAAAVLFPPAIAVAAKHDDHVAARELLRRGEILPLDHILDVAQRRVPGDVIEVELEHEDEGWEYEVKVLTPTGHVRKITLNARNGAVIKIKDD